MTEASENRDEFLSESARDHIPLMEGAGRGDPDARTMDEGKTDQQQREPSATLRRTPYGVFLTLGYAAIVLFAWVVTCTLARRPIGAESYVVDWRNNSDNVLNSLAPSQISQLFSKSEHYLRAARVLQSVASLLTIPLTSAVCSWAAVGFLQQRKEGQRGPTLRQSMTLADKAWTDPVLIAKLFAGGWSQYGSRFLLVAILLNGLGASIMPLQEILVSYETIKVPLGADSQDDLVGISYLVSHLQSSEDGDGGYTTTKLRSTLQSVDNTNPQFRLWSRDGGCSASLGNESNPVCAAAGQYTLGTMADLNDPFWAQMPSGFNTGLIQQFAPRVNFTSEYENITSDAFPQNCNQIPGALSLHYENVSDYGNYTVDVCMPGNMNQSPWKAQDSRQDFSEELYLQIRLGEDCGMCQNAGIPGLYTLKVTLNTSAGYFELPNYMNGQVPGPLLDDGPSPHCGQACAYQGYSPYNPNLAIRDTSNSTNGTSINATTALDNPLNGPLLYTALALFGPGSYLDIDHTVIEPYSGSQNQWGGCIGIVPFVSLLQEYQNSTDSSLPFSESMGLLYPCVAGADAVEQQEIVMSYLWLFTGFTRDQYPRRERIENAFAAAAFLTFDVWSMQNFDGSVDLFWDLGTDLEIPSIPRAGVILISVLLGTYLVCLISLALYAAWTPRWTNQLDSFAMMRIGASMADRFPLRLAHRPDKVKSLDELPGWIGHVADAESGAEDAKVHLVGELGLGGGMPLKGGRKYRSYVDDGKDRSCC